MLALYRSGCGDAPAPTRTHAARCSRSWVSSPVRLSSDSTARSSGRSASTRLSPASRGYAGRGVQTLLAGRLVPVLGSEVGSSPAGSRSASISPLTRRRADPDRPVRRAHAGIGASTMSCTSSSPHAGRQRRSTASSRVCRGSCASVERRSGDRDDELRPRARGGVYRRGRGVRCRHVPGGRARSRQVLPSGPEGTARVIDVPNTYATELDLDRRPVILKLHGGPRPRADVGELRRHRGRLHRIPPSERGGDVGSGGPGRAPAAEPLPLPGLRRARVELATRAESALGRRRP